MIKKILFLFVFLAFNTIYGQLTATLNVSPTTCSGNSDGSIIGFISNGIAPFTVTISPGGTSQQTNSNTFAFNSLSAGTYIISITDSSNAVFNSTAIITMPPPLTMTSSINGSTVTLSASGGIPPYQYSADGGPYVNINVFTNLNSGNHIFQVVDSNGCSVTSSIVVVNSSFSVNIGSTLDVPVSTFFANTTGGTSPFSYVWSYNGVPIAGANQQSIASGGNCGQFSVLVTDANNLTASASAFANCIPISANNDAITIGASNTQIVTSSISVLNNDFFNSLPASSQIANITLSPVNVPQGFQLNSNGTLSVLPGVVPGSYSLTYKICENANLNNCVSATITIMIPSNGFLLNAFIDLNNNNIQDFGEQNFNMGQFQHILNNNGVVINNFSSTGSLFIPETNTSNLYSFNYAINTDISSCYNLAVTNYNNIAVSLSGNATTYNFPIQINPCTDLAVFIYPYGVPPRPGFNFTNRILIKNNGNQNIANGTITFSKNDLISIVSISESGTTPTTNGFTLNFSNLLPNETRFIDITLSTPTIPTVVIGGVLTQTVEGTILGGSEINIQNNNSSLSQIIVGSYDPNDKSESHGGKIVHSTFTSSDYLNYTIQFENTGTYSAENVRINDVLDSKLDESSIKTISSSHPFLLSRSGNTLNWNFNNIDLPPSVANTSTGKGYVSFQVKPKPGYTIGDVITNSANIFFDFNPPITTNTVNTEFVAFLDRNEFNTEVFQLYPNPVKDFMTIESNNNKDVDNVTIVNILGEIVFSKDIYKSGSPLDLNSLKTGIYFIKLKSENTAKIIKFAKE